MSVVPLFTKERWIKVGYTWEPIIKNRRAARHHTVSRARRTTVLTAREVARWRSRSHRRSKRWLRQGIREVAGSNCLAYCVPRR
jgi:hypothetical protein